MLKFLCIALPATETSWAQNFGRETPIRLMGFSTLSPFWLNATRSRFKQFWLGGDAAFAGPDLYEFRERKRITYFI